jgi:hypothetical protein
MKKIKLIGVGTISDDMKFWTMSGSLYRELSARADELLEKAGRKSMGKYFDEPKPTRTELQTLLDNQKERLKTLRDFKTPECLLEGVKHHISELENKINNKDYENPLDPKYKKYKSNYKKKLYDWINSEEYTKLINDIYSYNKKRYQEFEAE